jgi:glycosyltransferase involved in cell wall biosynthesis
VIFVSEGQRRYWLSGGFMDTDKTKCIYNGIDVDHYKDDYSCEEKLEFRRKLGFAETAYVVGICARLHSGKNHAELIAALDTVRRKGIDAKVLIVGDGPERANLESLIKSKGLEQHVVITGFQEDIRPFISVSDCIALTSQAEAFPLSIIEGMAMGKPVISSEVGGTPEQIEHGQTGFLYKPGNTEQLAKYLEIMSDPALRTRMGERARHAACDMFSLRKMILEYDRTIAQTAAPKTDSQVLG